MLSEIMPVFKTEFTEEKAISTVKGILREKLSSYNDIRVPFVGKLDRDTFYFSKTSASVNYQSEFLYTGKLIPTSNSKTQIVIKGRYTILAYLGYLALMLLSIIISNTTSHYFMIAIFAIYAYMIVKIKNQSINTVREIKILLNS